MRRFKPTCRLAAASLTALALGAGPVAGQALDFSRYVAIGDSLTHAVVSFSIGELGQNSSYPLHIYRQATGNPTGFEQPLVSEPGIPGRLVLQSLAPLGLGMLPGLGQPLNLMLPRPYNNLGVSGFEVLDVLTVAGGDVPSDLVLRGLGTALEQAIVQQPSFISVWIGPNDALEAALSGIVVEGVTLTGVAAFERDYTTLLGALASTGAPMAVATIPPVTGIPFVTTLPPVVLDPATNRPLLVNGAPVPLIGPDGPLGPGDHVLGSALLAGELARGNGVPAFLGGSGRPLGDEFILDAAETAAIEARVAQFNAIIRATAQAVGAALVEADVIVAEAARDGFEIGGIEYDTSLFGGLFSLDGVHPSPLGYAVFANEFITAINARFGSTIPLVDLAPLVFGPGGSLGPPAPSAAATLSGRRALRNFRTVMGIPKYSLLKRLKRRELRGTLADGSVALRRSPAERLERVERRRNRRAASRR